MVALLKSDIKHIVLLGRWYLGRKDEKDPFIRWTVAYLSWTAGFKGEFEKAGHKDKIAAKFLYAMVAKDDVTYTSENAALMSDAGLNRATPVPGIKFKPPRSYGKEICEVVNPSSGKNVLGNNGSRTHLRGKHLTLA